MCNFFYLKYLPTLTWSLAIHGLRLNVPWPLEIGRASAACWWLRCHRPHRVLVLCPWLCSLTSGDIYLSSIQWGYEKRLYIRWQLGQNGTAISTENVKSHEASTAVWCSASKAEPNAVTAVVFFSQFRLWSLRVAFLGTFCIRIHFMSFPKKIVSESF